MKQRLRVAVAGTGYFSQFHFDAWSRCPEVDLVGVCGLDTRSVQDTADRHDMPAFSDAGDMLDSAKPDLFDIVTPPPTHLAMIREAASRGVEVVCQKPFCGVLEEAQKAVATARDAGISIVVHENFRFQPWYIALANELQAGRLGKLYQATFRLRPGDGQGPEAYLERQPYFQKMDRFLVHETAVHYIDVFRFLFGDAASVFADLRRLNPQISGEDSGMILLEFGDGLRGVIDGNRLSDHKAANRRLTMGEMLIEGERGTLSLDGDANIGFRAHDSNEEVAIDYDWTDHGFGGDCVYRFTRHVVDHHCHRTPLQNSAADYLTNLEIEEAVYASAAQGRRISL